MMKPWLLLIFAIIALALSCDADDAQTSEAASERTDDMHLILLIGQSNMAGRGKVSDEDREPHPRVLMLNKTGDWVPAVDPLHFDKPKIVGVGLGRTFGIEYAEANPEVTVGLVPCAVGGSPISSWEPGGYHEQTKTHPWDDMLPRIEKALDGGTLKAILWHQGESDSNAQAAPLYEERLRSLVRRLRESLDAADVPFIAGQMGQFEEKPWSDAKWVVDQVHRDLPTTTPRTAFVNSDGLTHKGDAVHFDASSYRELGRRYFAAYQKLVAP